MRGDEMVIEGKRGWSGLIMIHDKIPQRLLEPAAKIGYYAALFRQRVVKIPATSFQLRPFIWDNNTSHSSGT